MGFWMSAYVSAGTSLVVQYEFLGGFDRLSLWTPDLLSWWYGRRGFFLLGWLVSLGCGSGVIYLAWVSVFGCLA